MLIPLSYKTWEHETKYQRTEHSASLLAFDINNKLQQKLFWTSKSADTVQKLCEYLLGSQGYHKLKFSWRDSCSCSNIYGSIR